MNKKSKNLNENNGLDIIQPRDKETIKYLSNVIDSNTGDVSKPFTIGEKKYQMVRGMTPSKNIVLGVYCFDDFDENNGNLIHPMDYFEENIAKPMKERMDILDEVDGADDEQKMLPDVERALDQTYNRVPTLSKIDSDKEKFQYFYELLKKSNMAPSFLKKLALKMTQMSSGKSLSMTENTKKFKKNLNK